MARLKQAETPAFEGDLYDASLAPPSTRSTPTNASDKENRRAPTGDVRDKGRSTTSTSVGRELADQSARPAKRKMPANERDRCRRPRTASPSADNSESDDPYNPDQSIEERRRLRGQLRDLEKDVSENRAEFLQPNNDGIRRTLEAADRITGRVKQTADATIDSRLLVNTSDLALKKVEKLTLGNSQLGVDVDHFIAKCMSFMRNGGAASGEGRASGTERGTQRRRATQMGNADSDDEDGEIGDMLDWAHLGAHACLPYNSRPSVPGFLFGPLSVEKRARRVVQRRVGNTNKDIAETRPEILRAEDIHKEDNNNLTVLCHRINRRLRECSEEQMAACEAAAEALREDMTDEQGEALMLEHGVDDEGNVDLLRFCINPRSFGQTVENMFYVSFLIRDGTVGIVVSDDGLPYLSKSNGLVSRRGITNTGQCPMTRTRIRANSAPMSKV